MAIPLIPPELVEFPDEELEPLEEVLPEEALPEVALDPPVTLIGTSFHI